MHCEVESYPQPDWVAGVQVRACQRDPFVVKVEGLIEVGTAGADIVFAGVTVIVANHFQKEHTRLRVLSKRQALVFAQFADLVTLLNQKPLQSLAVYLQVLVVLGELVEGSYVSHQFD